jgi:DNA-binding transcriptional ArsR family regulator
VVAARFDVTFGAVSQHLRVLEDAGLVSVRRDGRRRLYQARQEQLGPLRGRARGPVALRPGGAQGPGRDRGEERPWRVGYPAGSSTVEITLEPQAGGTRVRLRHAGLPAGEPPMAHLAGWRHVLATLAYRGAADQLAPVLDERVADWQTAWNEPEPARRVALLERCLSDGGRFRWVTGFWDRPRIAPNHHSVPDQAEGSSRATRSILTRKNATNPPDSRRILHTGSERAKLCGHGGARSVRLPEARTTPGRADRP